MTDTSKVRAVAWDPSGTSSLSICPIPSTGGPSSKSSAAANKDEFLLDVFLSHDGTGCNAEETECLLRQLDARDDWIEEQQTQSRRKNGTTKNSKSAMTKLSMDYRAAMCECLMQLQTKQQKQQQQDMSDDDNNNDSSSSSSSDNLELLTLTFAISHLAEIFLLPSLSTSSNFRGTTTTNNNNNSRLDDGPSGSLTADTVRYLRLHHSKSHTLLDSPEVEELLSSDQPEYHKPNNGNTSIPGPFEYPYWNLVLQLVKSGQLDNAWTVLTHHSACRHAEEAAMTGRPLTPEGEGFATLRAILLSAPLPGGRGDDYCVDDAGLDDFLEEDILEREEKEARLNNGFNNNRNDDDEEEEDEENVPPENINELYVDGVPRNGYLLWEDRPRHADRLRKLRYLRDLRKCGQPSDESEYHSPAVLPEFYQPNSAMGIFHTWQDVIKREASFTSSGSGHSGCGLAALFRRFPPLQQILSVLVGKVPPNIANDPSLTWSETLLMELLYSRPDISPENIAARANAIMSSKGNGKKHALDEIILSIMSGSAGQVVETMFSLCGGSSGAALPATVTSLLCNLLIDAGCITSEEASSSSVNIQTELLILAAEAILSSFSVQEQSNVGVRAAVRLLLPHAPPKRIDGEVVYEPRISATIAEAISHRLPDSDAEARDLLHLCEEAIRLGSVRIADACESLAFSRASFHRSKGHLHREVYWLLRGMEILSNELPTQFQRKLGFACRRHFDALCENSANDLISMLASTTYAMNEESKLEEEAFVTVLTSARNVLEAVVQDEDMASLLKGHMQANFLKFVVDIALADALGDTTKMASDIVRCLEERCLPGEEYGGVVSTLASPKMYAKLLHISVAILHKEESLCNGTMESTKCAFSVHGMHILMARLTQVLSWEGITTSSSAIPKTPTKERKEYFHAMRLTLCKGLMRAFASAQAHSSMEKDGKGGRAEQSLEDEVELMLSPCI